MPILIGCGTVTGGASFTEVHRASARALGAELVVLEGADHSAHTNQPEAWAQFVRATVALAEGR